MIRDNVRINLQDHMIATFANLGSFVQSIYANTDHLHVLCSLPRTITIAEMISKVKSSSSRWLKAQGIDNFSWQGGYATFSVSSSDLENVRNYIQNQAEHHNTSSYQDELRQFFKDYNIDYDERNVWD